MIITTKAAINAAETKPICALDPEKKEHVNILSIAPTILVILVIILKIVEVFFRILAFIS